MRIIIAGAGAVGGLAAHALCYRGNDVTVIDPDETVLVQLREETDVMTLQGSATFPAVLVEAGIQKTDLLLALTGNSEANIVICGLAKAFGVPSKVGRLRSGRYFDLPSNMGPDKFGIDDYIIPEEACVQEIMDSLKRPAVRESVSIGTNFCEMVNFHVPPDSPLANVQVQAAPCRDLLERLRICAIKRHGHLIVPRGNTLVNVHDEAYVAGRREDVDAFINWATPGIRPIKRVVVTGASNIACQLVDQAQAMGMSLSIIVSNDADAQDMVEEHRAQTTIIRGESTDASVLEEAAVDQADAVVAAGTDNESNILTCILAKRMGAKKVIPVVNNSNYSQIIANLTMIDCAFNPLIAAVDSLLQHIDSEARQHVALLKRIDAEVLNLGITKKTRIAGKRIADIDMPADLIFVAIFRNGEFVPPVGQETLSVGDRVVVLVRQHCKTLVERLFSGNRLF